MVAGKATGAGEGIRTLDPNLGKRVTARPGATLLTGILRDSGARRCAHVRRNPSESGQCPCRISAVCCATFSGAPRRGQGMRSRPIGEYPGNAAAAELPPVRPPRPADLPRAVLSSKATPGVMCSVDATDRSGGFGAPEGDARGASGSAAARASLWPMTGRVEDAEARLLASRTADGLARGCRLRRDRKLYAGVVEQRSPATRGGSAWSRPTPGLSRSASGAGAAHVNRGAAGIDTPGSASTSSLPGGATSNSVA
jgi:hypothetical protein